MSGRKRRGGAGIRPKEDHRQRKITSFFAPIQRDDQATGGFHHPYQHADAVPTEEVSSRRVMNLEGRTPLFQVGNERPAPVLVDITSDSDEEPGGITVLSESGDATSISGASRRSESTLDYSPTIKEDTVSSTIVGSKARKPEAASDDCLPSSSRSSDSLDLSDTETQISAHSSGKFHSSKSETVLESDEGDSMVDWSSEEKDSQEESKWHKLKKFRFFTKEKENGEFIEAVFDLPSIQSLDSSSFEKPVKNLRKRDEIFNAAFQDCAKRMGISVAPGEKTRTCCAKTFKRFSDLKCHVAANHLPCATISHYYLQRISALHVFGLSAIPDILDGIKSKESAEFLFHFRTRAEAIANKQTYQYCAYSLLLFKNLPSDVHADKVLQYASSNGIVIECYEGKNSRGKVSREVNCSSYHFMKADNIRNSFVTQCLLQGYRCFSVVEEKVRAFDTKEGMEIAEMLSQLFLKFCARYTQLHGGYFTFSCRQHFEHGVASKHLVDESMFFKVVEDVIKCKGQAVVSGDSNVTIPFNGMYGQLKPVKLVEQFLNRDAKFEITENVEEKPITRHVLDKVTSKSRDQGLDLKYDVAHPNEMKRLWEILNEKYEDSNSNRNASRERNISLVITVPTSFDAKEKNVYEFIKNEIQNGRRVMYDFLRETEAHLYYKFIDPDQKYLVVKKWNFDSTEEKTKFFSFVMIYSHFQTALDDQYFEFAHFRGKQLWYKDASRLLTNHDLRYAYALGISGRPVICLEEDCNTNHYIFSDQKFVVPVKMDRRVMINVPVSKCRN